MSENTNPTPQEDPRIKALEGIVEKQAQEIEDLKAALKEQENKNVPERKRSSADLPVVSIRGKQYQFVLPRGVVAGLGIVVAEEAVKDPAFCENLLKQAPSLFQEVRK